MNVENILKVADAIEHHSIPDLGFNMGLVHSEGEFVLDDVSGHNCGTTACIAGWANAIRTGGRIDVESVAGAGAAANWLGLSPPAADYLFLMDVSDDFTPPPIPMETITPAQAVSCLRHLAETGEVDWPRAVAEA